MKIPSGRSNRAKGSQPLLSVSNQQQRFFGVLDIRTELAGGVSLSIGLRNSTLLSEAPSNKANNVSGPRRFRAAAKPGQGLSALVVISKRHTRFGSDRFREGIAAAIGRLNDYRAIEAQRIATLQSQSLADTTAESIVLRAWEQVLAGTRLLRPLLDEWRQPEA